MTLPVQLVLREMLADPGRAMYGLELSGLTKLAPGTIQPILARLERYEWLESHWEDLDPHEAGRPRRRYYRLTRKGASRGAHALNGASARIRLVDRLHARDATGSL